MDEMDEMDGTYDITNDVWTFITDLNRTGFNDITSFQSTHKIFLQMQESLDNGIPWQYEDRSFTDAEGFFEWLGSVLVNNNDPRYSDLQRCISLMGFHVDVHSMQNLLISTTISKTISTTISNDIK